MKRPFKKGQPVRDRWWPWRSGIVTGCAPSRAVVRWLDGEIWIYDREHMKFLEAL